MRINQFLRVLVLILSPLFSFAQTDLKDFGKFLYQKNSKVTTINLDSVFQLNFSKYVKMETFNLEGVHLIKDFKIVLKNLIYLIYFLKMPVLRLVFFATLDRRISPIGRA